ncbi:MAG: hypothetical protein OEM97_01565 [Acidimicrobiia bacterium]|nr:hypothetical protein [Acidimicrobiia bacterium]
MRDGPPRTARRDSVIGQSVFDIGFDGFGRPLVMLTSRHQVTPVHTVLLESLRPVVVGFCRTCFEGHMGAEHRASRKARSCDLMVAYLSAVNRDRAMRTRLEDELQRVHDLEDLLVS